MFGKIIVEIYVHVVVWLQLLFTRKYIKIIYFYLKKIIFDINISKWSKNTKKIINMK